MEEQKLVPESAESRDALPRTVFFDRQLRQRDRTGLASVEEISTVLQQMDRGHAVLKLGALYILRRMGPTMPRSLNRESVAEAIHLRIDWKGSDPVEVRTAAIEALAALGPEAIPALREASQNDADQMVRYRAAVVMTELAPAGGGG